MVPTLLHLHIPKCGGVSIKNFLADEFAGKRFYTYADDAQLNTDLADGGRAASALAISGHFPWGLHTKIDRPSVYFVLLRNPIDRIASLFDFAGRTSSHPAYATINRPGMTIAELYRDHISPDSQFRNGMVRQISGRDDNDSKRHLDAALVNLLSPCCISGALEELPAALDRLRQLLFIGPGLPAATNTSPSRRALSDEDVEAIRAANAQDMKLHAMVLAAARKVNPRRAREAPRPTSNANPR